MKDKEYSIGLLNWIILIVFAWVFVEWIFGPISLIHRGFLTLDPFFCILTINTSIMVLMLANGKINPNIGMIRMRFNNGTGKEGE